MKQLSVAFKQYAEDYDDYLPSVERFYFPQNLPVPNLPHGWADAILPYTKNSSLFQCQAEETPINQSHEATQDDFTDYYLNANLSGLLQRKVVSKETTIMLGDGRDGIDLTDARYNHCSLPQRWIKDENSPAWRHLGAANYAFADGHVKTVWVDQIKTNHANKDDYSFAVK